MAQRRCCCCCKIFHPSRSAMQLTLIRCWLQIQSKIGSCCLLPLAGGVLSCQLWTGCMARPLLTLTASQHALPTCRNTSAQPSHTNTIANPSNPTQVLHFSRPQTSHYDAVVYLCCFPPISATYEHRRPGSSDVVSVRTGTDCSGYSLTATTA